MARAERAGQHIPRIALTGGIASGKSTVAGLFAALGARLIDADRIARELVAPGSPALAQIAARFGPDILAADGTLDRAALREQVFANRDSRAALEAILHPLIRAEMTARAARLGGPYQIFEVPLLAETGARDEYDRVVVVDADPAQQRLRLMLRDGIDAPAAQQMIDAQASREQRLAIADDVITNSGDIAQLAAQVERLHEAYLAGQGYAK